VSNIKWFFKPLLNSTRLLGGGFRIGFLPHPQVIPRIPTAANLLDMRGFQLSPGAKVQGLEVIMGLANGMNVQS